MFRGFVEEDITHHSKRTQAGNLRLAQGKDYIESENSEVDESSIPKILVKDIPQTLTLESMIIFYRENAIGDLANIFKFTADTLEKYRTASRTAINRLIQSAEDKKDEGVIEFNLNNSMAETKED